MSQGYATANALTGLIAGSFTWSSGSTSNRARLNDGILDEVVSGSAAAQASGQTLVFDLGAATALVGIALLNHNLATGACTVLVEADTVNTFATAVTVKAATNIATTAPNHKDAVLQFPGVSKRYWRLTFVHTGTKILAFGEILALTSIVTLSRSSIYGDGENERANLNKNVSATGNQRATFVSGPVRTKRRMYKDLSTSDKAELRAMWAATTYGTSNLLWLDFIESTSTAATAASQECLWGKIAEEFDWSQPDYQLFDPNQFTIVGLGREVGS